MKRTVYVVVLLMSFAFASHVVAAEFKIYPGATIDQKATKDATEVLKQSGMTGRATIYTTSDAFEKVVAFYKGMAKEWQMPRGEGEKLLSFAQAEFSERPTSSLTGQRTSRLRNSGSKSSGPISAR